MTVSKSLKDREIHQLRTITRKLLCAWQLQCSASSGKLQCRLSTKTVQSRTHKPKITCHLSRSRHHIQQFQFRISLEDVFMFVFPVASHHCHDTILTIVIRHVLQLEISLILTHSQHRQQTELKSHTSSRNRTGHVHHVPTGTIPNCEPKHRNRLRFWELLTFGQMSVP